MLQLLFIASFLSFPLVIAVLLGILGYRKGWHFGVIALSASVAAAALSYITALILSRRLTGLAIVGDIKNDIADALAGAGIGGIAWEGIFDLTLSRVLFMALIPISFALIYTTICVVWAVVGTKRKPVLVWQKLTGLGLGLCAAAFAGAFCLLASRISVPGEAARAQRVHDIARSVVGGGQIDLPGMADRLPEILDIYFETGLLAADEAARAELLTDIANGAFNAAFPGLNTLLIVSPSRAHLMRDAETVAAFIRFADNRGLLDNIDNLSRDDIIKMLADTGTAYEVAGYLFNLSFSEELARAVMTLVVRDTTGSAAFVYPRGIIASDAETAFANAMISLYRFMDLPDDAPRRDALTVVFEIRDSHLFPAPVFAYMRGALQ
jgi:hypothetical protein